MIGTKRNYSTAFDIESFELNHPFGREEKGKIWFFLK